MHYKYFYDDEDTEVPKVKIGTRLPTIEAQRKFFSSLADKEGITVVWSKESIRPHASITGGRGKITLNTPGIHSIVQWLGEAHHEVSHLFKEVLFTYDTLHMLTRHVEKDVANIYADYLCEYNKHEIYPGRDRIMWEMRAGLYAGKTDSWAHLDSVGLAALLTVDIRRRRYWQGMLPEMDVNPRSEPYMAALEEIGAYDRAERLLITQSPEDFYQLILETCEIIMDASLDPDSDEGDEDEPDGDGEGEPGDGKGKGRGSRSSSESGAGGGGMGVGDSGRGEEDEVPDMTEESDEVSEDDKPKDERATDAGEIESEDPDEGLLPDYEESELPDEIVELEEKRVSTRDEEYTPFENHLHIIPNYRVETTALEQITNRLKGSTVSKRIKRYLKIVSKDSFSYGQKKGKLHVKNMHRIYGHSDEPRIFKRKDRGILKTDTAVQVMLDCSGSMGGNRYWTGAACCVAISQCLTDLRIVHEILGYSEDYKLWTYYFKTFDQSMSKDKLLRGFSSTNINLCENADGESVLYGAERLSVRKEKHKLMLVLSDGSPCGTYTGNGYWYLKLVANSIEAAGIDLMGIGIQTTSVKEFYNKHYVVNNVSDLDSVLFEHLKKSLVG